MANEVSFKPRRGGNKRLIAGLTAASSVIGAGESCVRIINEGSQICWVVFYNSAVTPARIATIADTPVTTATSAGAVTVIKKGVDDDTVSFISAAAGQVINFQPGEMGN